MNERVKNGRKGWRRRKRVASEKGGFLLPFSRDDDNATTTTRGNSFGGTGDDEHHSPILAREKATPHSSTGWCCVFEDAPRSPATVNAIRARVRSFLRSSSRTFSSGCNDAVCMFKQYAYVKRVPV